MKKLCLLLGIGLSTLMHGQSKSVQIVNMSDFDLVIKALTIHDYYQFVGTTATGPGPVTHGYDIGALSNYSYSSNVIIVPAGQTVDLYDYVNGSYDASLNNYGTFPFGWNSTLNPFFGNVYTYGTVGGVDSPTSTTPITLPIGYPVDFSCVKSMTIGWVNADPGNNFQVLYEATHTSADGSTPKVEVTTDGDILISKYEHLPITNWYGTSVCSQDRLTFSFSSL